MLKGNFSKKFDGILDLEISAKRFDENKINIFVFFKIFFFQKILFNRKTYEYS